MQKNYTILKGLFLVLGLFFTSSLMAQTKISGKITDASSNETLAGVNIAVVGKVVGTTTDNTGAYSLTTTVPAPFTIRVSFVGYGTKEILVTGSKVINIALEEQALQTQEVVVSASRVEESVMKSPVSVEKMDIRAIRETPAASFYDGLNNIKGVDMATQGLLFKSINLRGFGSTGNPRVVQMIDGMDNSAPGLNFPVDNIVGMPELDVESVEILPGAASALYGPNALNGLILMNSKSPFLYQGLSAQVKSGIMHANNRDKTNTPYNDVSIRWAKALTEKLALKLNFGYITATDWAASNTENLNQDKRNFPQVSNGGRGYGVNTDYDGINVYGDEVQANMVTVANSLIAAKLLPASALAAIPNLNVSRTGFLEKDLANYNTKSLKFNAAAHYKLNDKYELVIQGNYGNGTTMYTGTGRYSLNDFTISQLKAELKGDALTARVYTTLENSGKSYFTGLQAVSMLDSIKTHATWFGEYVGTYAQALGAGTPADRAHLLARAKADDKMPKVGSPEFEALKDEYAGRTIAPKNGGGAFSDNSKLIHGEVVYNLKNHIKFADVLVGGNLRRYILQSKGTLFNDQYDGRNGTIGINEVGAFIQASKSFFKDHLRITGSLRYDKNQNFDSQLSPRISSVLSFGQHNFRVSYQTGFRIPTTQNQYINLATPSGTLIGALDEFNTIYKLETGLSLADLTSANIAKFASTAEVQAKAKAYAEAAITAQATPLVKAGVEAEIKRQVTAGLTKFITDQVTASVTKAITDQVTAGVTAAIEAEVTKQVTAVIQKQVTDAVTATVNKQIADGLLLAANKDAAIKAGIDIELPKALTANLAGGVAAQLPAALNANLAAGVASQLPAALEANLAKNVALELPKQLELNLDKNVAAQLPGALAANFQPAFDAELKRQIAANSPSVINQVLPAYALAAIPKYKAKKLVPEKIASWEIGYKGIIAQKLMVDAYYYNSEYRNFVGGTSILVPTAPAGPGLPIESGVSSASTRNAYSRPSNSSAKITSKGWAGSLNYSIGKGYYVGFNSSFNTLTGFTPTAEQQYAGYNTPEYRFNYSLGKRLNSGEKIGFNVTVRQQDGFNYEGGFMLPTTTSLDRFYATNVPSIVNTDAQVSFKLPAFKSIVKLGGTNILGKKYYQAYGSAVIGSMYYVSVNFDELFNR